MQNKKGFTLIELLVVVLIIGILASVALPQYQKAVIKAKLSQLTVTIDAVKKGVDLYLLSEGWPSDGISFTAQPNLLDVEIPGEHRGGMYVSKIGGVSAWAGREAVGIQYESTQVSAGNSDWFDLTIFAMYKTPQRNQWVVETLDSATDTSLAIICQWFKSHGYPANEEVFGQCRDVGVTLEKV